MDDRIITQKIACASISILGLSTKTYTVSGFLKRRVLKLLILFQYMIQQIKPAIANRKPKYGITDAKKSKHMVIPKFVPG